MYDKSCKPVRISTNYLVFEKICILEITCTEYPKTNMQVIINASMVMKLLAKYLLFLLLA